MNPNSRRRAGRSGSKRTCRAGMLALEPRIVMAGGTGGFATIEGIAGRFVRPGVFDVRIDPATFTAPGGRVLVDVTITGGSGLPTPRLVGVLPRGGTPVRLLASTATLGRTDSTVEAAPGSYRLLVAATGNRPVPFRIDVSLSGDVNGDFRVDGADLQAIRTALGRRAGQPGYDASLDVNRDRVVNRLDLNLAGRNLGAATTVRPLALSARVDPSVPVNGKGEVLGSTAIVSGTTAPGALVRFDKGNDGSFEQSARADGSGRYQFSVSIGPGTTAVRAEASTAIGQRVGAVLALRRAPASPAPPVVTLSGPADNLLTRTNITVTGRVVADGAATLSARIDGGPAVVVRPDASGRFRYTTTLRSGGLDDGPHTVTFVAVGPSGAASRPVAVRFRLDTVAPPITAFGLAPESDSAPVGDRQTINATVSLIGQTEPGVALRLVETGATTRANAQGAFRFDGLALPTGPFTFQVVATDAAGNTRQASETITRLTAGQTDPVLTWNQTALAAIQADASTPPVASRALAIVQASVFDAVNAVMGTRGYYVSLAAPAGASAEAAVASAAHDALMWLYPAQTATFDAALATSLAALPAGASRDAGVAVGRQVAAAIVAARANDGSTVYTVDEGIAAPGLWRPTAPAFATGIEPQWGSVTPFALTSSSQFRPPGPPALGSAAFAADFATVKSLGNTTSTTRTADQTQIARFWADGAGTITPVGHWNRIAQGVARGRGNSLLENARLFAMLDIAMADAAIAAWDAKYTYDFWRPITAIREGDVAANPTLIADPSWTPLISTPPFPEYVSGHSTFSATASAVLSSVFGPDTAFSSDSPGLAGVTRSFGSFDQAVEEAGISRIYGGIHFPTADRDGQALGKSIGQFVLDTFATTTADKAPPVLSVTSPASGAVLRQVATVDGRVNDFGSGVASLSARVDSGASVALSFDPRTGAFSLPVSLTGDGLHHVVLVATDSAGNSATLDRSFTVDATAPVLTIDSIAEGAALDARTRLTGTADPTGTSLVRLVYAIDGGTAIPLAFDPTLGAFDAPLALGALAPGAHTLVVSATDAAGNIAETTLRVSLPTAVPLTVTSVSPTSGTVDVGTTFRPRVVFSRPVNPTTLTSASLSLRFSGEVLPATIVPSTDGTFALLMPTEPLPGGAVVTLEVDGSAIRAADGGALDAAGTGVPGSLLRVQFTTVSRSDVPGTSLSGVVADPGPDLMPMTIDDVKAGPDGVLNTGDDIYLHPIAGVKVFVIGQESRVVTTDASGRFVLENVPSGNVKLALDGLTATNAPSGVYFPEMVMDLNLQPGRAQTVMGTMGDPTRAASLAADRGVYLARLRTSLLHTVDNAVGASLGVDGASAPDLTPEQRSRLRLELAPNSLIGLDGRPMASASVGVSTVPPELVRDMLPQGVTQLATTLTLQAPGVAAFATPARLSVPNVYGAAPGSKLNFYSFDHTTGRLEITGAATVSADGTTVTSDPDGGILHPGWFGVVPGTDCVPCKEANDGGSDDTSDFPDDEPPPSLAPQSRLATAASGLMAEGNGLSDHFLVRNNERFKFKFTNTLPDSGGEESKIKVRVEIDGPYDEFLDGLRGVANKTFTLCPKQSLDFTATAKSLRELLQALGDGAARDTLYGMNIRIRGVNQGNKIYDKSFNYLRFLAVVDPETALEPDDTHTDALFLKTLSGGGFDRTKGVDYFLPKKTSKTDLMLDGDNEGNFTIAASTGLTGNGRLEWTFQPPAATGLKDYEARVKIKMTRGQKSDVGSITAKGSGIAPTTIGPNEADFKAKFRTYLTDPNNFPNPAIRGASPAFRREFAAALPEANPTEATLQAAIDRAFNDLFAGLQTKYAPVNVGGQAVTVVRASGPNTRVLWHVGDIGALTPAAGAPITVTTDFGITITDRNYNGDNRGPLYDALRSDEVPMVAKEYVLAQEINLAQAPPGGTTDNRIVNNFVHYTIGRLASFYNSTISFGQYTANTVAHELAHTFGVLDSYTRSGAGGNRPPDLMSAKSRTEPARTFDQPRNGLTVAAAAGIAPNDPGALRQAVTNYRSNFNKPRLLEGIQDPEAFPAPQLTLSDGSGFVLPGDVQDFGSVIDDGPGGALVTRSLVISNEGSLPLTILGAGLGAGGRGFSFDNTGLVGLTLQPYEGRTVDVRFDPSLPGAATDTLVVTTDQVDSPYRVDLKGLALPHRGQVSVKLPVDPASNRGMMNNFGGVVIGGSAATVAGFATITNTGGGDLTITGVVVSKGTGEYTVSGLPPGFDADHPVVLAPGQSIALDVSFAPSASGLRPGRIDVLSDDPLTPVAPIAVTGTGLKVRNQRARIDDNFIAIESPDNPRFPVLRRRTDNLGNWSFVLAGETSYHYEQFDPKTGLIATGVGETGPTGRMSMLLAPTFRASTAPDTDGDGLPDDVEFAIGTSSAKADTNGDGVSDFAAVQANLSPTALGVFPTGVVASLGLRGPAREVVVGASPGADGRQTAFVANNLGLSVVDVTRFDRPVLLGSLRLPGDCDSVAYDDRAGLAVVAAGGLGIHVVDVSDPTRPTLLRTIPVTSSVVRIVDGVAYSASGGLRAGADNVLTAVDPRSGAVLGQRAYGGGAIVDIAVSQGFLYTVSNSGLVHTVQKIEATDDPDVPEASLLVLDHPTFGLLHIFADAGLIYVGGADNNFAQQIPGVEVLRDEGPRITLIGAPSGITAFDVTTNGSGLALFAGANPSLEQDADVALLDVSDPTRTDRFVVSFPVNGSARDITVASGVAYVAADSGGLQVVNYLEFDSAGRAPTVSITSPVTDLDPALPGVQINEGGDLPVFVRAADDVQVARVELLVDGQVVAADVSAPFEFYTSAPLLASGATGVRVQVRATDTGGNVALSNVLSFGIVRDSGLPVLTRSTPSQGAEVATASGIVLRFSESIDPALVVASGFTLTRDGAPVPIQRVAASSNRGVSVVPAASLPFGRYTLTVDPSVIADRTGNHIAAPVSLTFTVGFAQVVSTSPTPGSTADRPVTSITLGFNTEVNGVPPAASDFTLRGAGADAVIGTSDDVSIPFTGLAFNTAGDQITLSLASALRPDSYRLTARASKLLDRYGRPLDGEFSTSFPSGDNQPGGDFVLSFTVVAQGTLAFDAFPGRVYPNQLPDISLLTSNSPGVVADLNGDGRLDVLRTIHGRVFAGFSGGQQVFNPVDTVSVIYGKAGGGFTDPVAFNVGPGASLATVADFNADGIPDIVVLDNPGDVNRFQPFELSVLLGNGTGFLPERRIVTGLSGNEPGMFATGDFNADGKTDLALIVTRQRSAPPGTAAPNRVVVFNGVGDGTFAAPAVTAIGSDNFEHQLFAADLNRDGKLDLVSTNHVLLNNGGGGFTSTAFDLGTTVTAVADLNGDGRPDLVTATPAFEFEPGSEGTVIAERVELRVAPGNGDGTFGAPITVNVPIGGGFGGDTNTRFVTTTVADLNNDGKPDLVVAAADNSIDPRGGAAVLRGRGDGTFDAPTLIPVSGTSNRFFPVSVAVGDASGDGKADLIVALPPNADVLLRTTVIVGNGDGTFLLPKLDPSLAPRDVASEVVGTRVATDLNGDGRIDVLRLVVPRSGDPATLQVLRGVGDGTFAALATAATLPAGYQPGELAVGDVTGDGKPDAVVWTLSSAFDLRLLPGRGDGTFGPAQVLVTDVNSVSDLALADVNGDGVSDLVRIINNVGLVVNLNDGHGALGANILSPSFQSGVFRGLLDFGDFNRDGKLDIANNDNGIALGRGDGQFFRGGRPFLGVGGAPLIGADINGDGKPDLIGTTGRGLYINLGNGDGTLQDGYQLVVPNTIPFAVTAADLDGDGAVDLILSSDEEIDILLNNGDGTFQAPFRLFARGLSRLTPAVQALVADLNGDGLLDILAGDTILLRKRP